MNSISFAGAHLVVLGTWLVAALALAGLGTWTLRWFGARLETWRDLSSAFWLGIATAICIAQLWNFLAPVDGVASAVLVVAGAGGLWSTRRELGHLIRSPGTLSRGSALCITLLLIWLANRAVGPSRLYDTGMYHQPFVNWANAWPVIPGLGNLHGRLAFNPSSLLFAALLDTGPLDKLAFHLMNGLLYAILLIEGFTSWAVMRHSSAPRAYHLFSIAILPNVIHGGLRPDVRSLSTDAAVGAMLFAGVRLLFDALAHRAPAWRARGPQVAVIVTLLAAATTMKLSAAVVAVASAALAMLLLFPRNGEDEPLHATKIARWVLPALVLGIAWMGRSVVLSGYPLFPLDVLPAGVDWQMLPEHVNAERAWIDASAKGLNTNVYSPGLTWLKPWLVRVVTVPDLFVEFTLPLLALGCIVLAGVVRWRSRGPTRWSPGWWWIALPLIVGGVVWALTAPHPRLVHGVLWSSAAIALSYAAVSWTRRWAPARFLGIIVACLTIALAFKQGAEAAQVGGRSLSAVLSAWLTLPGEPYLEPLPRRGYNAFVTNTGLALAVPDGDNRCYNGPILCTPHPEPHLEARDPADIGRGFRTAGDRWEPMRWPNPWSNFLRFWRCSRDGSAVALENGSANERGGRQASCQRMITEQDAREKR